MARTRVEVVAGIGEEVVGGISDEVVAGFVAGVDISCLYDGGHDACHCHDDVGVDHGAHGAGVGVDGHGACHDGELY